MSPDEPEVAPQRISLGARHTEPLPFRVLVAEWPIRSTISAMQNRQCSWSPSDVAGNTRRVQVASESMIIVMPYPACHWPSATGHGCDLHGMRGVQKGASKVAMRGLRRARPGPQSPDPGPGHSPARHSFTLRRCVNVPSNQRAVAAGISWTASAGRSARLVGISRSFCHRSNESARPQHLLETSAPGAAARYRVGSPRSALGENQRFSCITVLLTAVPPRTRQFAVMSCLPPATRSRSESDSSPSAAVYGMIT